MMCFPLHLEPPCESLLCTARLTERGLRRRTRAQRKRKLSMLSQLKCSRVACAVFAKRALAQQPVRV